MEQKTGLLSDLEKTAEGWTEH